MSISDLDCVIEDSNNKARTGGLGECSSIGAYRLKLHRGEDGAFWLTSYSGGFLTNLSALARRFKTADWLLAMLGEQDGALRVPPAKLEAVQAIFQAGLDPDLGLSLTPQVASLRKLPLPDIGPIQYRWSDSTRCLRREGDWQYAGDGWLVGPGIYFQLPAPAAEDENWLKKSCIEGEELLPFLQQVINEWQRRGWPFSSELTYSSEPAVVFEVQTVTEQAAHLSVEWLTEAGSVREIPGFTGVVCTGRRLRPGFSPEQLGQWVDDAQTSVRLEGESIPSFLQYIGVWGRRCLLDHQQLLARMHAVFQSQGRLELVACREEHRGIGVVQAVPMFCIPDCSVTAGSLSEQMADAREYLRLPAGWIPKETALAAGLAGYGRAADGSALDPVSMTPQEVLWGGSPRLEGPWKLQLRPPELPSGRGKEGALEHLCFLRQWGLPGGLVGTVHEYGQALMEFLCTYSNQQSDARILLVGTKTVLNYVCKLSDFLQITRLDNRQRLDQSRPGLVAATPAALEECPDLQQIQWDVVCCFNADELIKSRSTRLFTNLSRLQRVLFVGLFADLSFRQRTPAREAFSILFEIEEAGSPHLLWRHLIRNPNELPWQLTSAYGSRTEESDPIVRAKSCYPVPYNYETSRFLADAAALVNRRAQPCEFVEYYRPRPSYVSMSRRQLNWYLYWRDQVRRESFPPTGLDYIMLFVYELINGFGVADVAEGYAQLHRLWLAYRHKFPALDNSLPGLLSDYLLVNGCPLDPLQPYREALELGVAVPYFDLLLKDCLKQSGAPLTFSMVERLIDYQLQRSRFCQEGHRSSLERAVMAVLPQVDAWFEQEHRAGMWAYFRPHRYRLVRRLPLANVPYASPTHYINLGSALPYSEQVHLRALLTGVVKHVENVLRDQERWRGRLRSYHLDNELARVIEAALRRPRPPRRPPRVIIDATRVADIARQSDEVRSLLLSSCDGEPAEAPPPADAWLRKAELPPTTSEGAMDAASAPPSDAWEVLEGTLTAEQVAALLVLATDPAAFPAWCQEQGQLPELVVDEINAVALDVIGDLVLDTATGDHCVLEEYRQQVSRLVKAERGEENYGN